MTDNEIIKTLECCKKDDCDNCPNDFGNCYANLSGYALDLINRQQAEIERLQNTINDILDRQPILVERAEKYAKSEAVKEFAEMLKDYLRKRPKWNCRREKYDNVGFSYDDVFFGIDKIVKEYQERTK